VRPHESNNPNDSQLTYYVRIGRGNTEGGRVEFWYLAPHYTIDGEWVGRIW